MTENKLQITNSIIKQSRYGYQKNRSKGKKVNFGAGGNRKVKVSLAKIKGLGK